MPDVTVFREVGQAVADAADGSLLDRAITYLSPRAGARRMQARASMALASSLSRRWGSSGYVGARSDRHSMREWDPYPGSADADQLPGLEVLRARSRDLVRNAPIAAGAINTTVTNVVGSGLKMQARPDRAVLGLTDEEAEAWEARAELIWRTWCNADSCDLTGEQDFAGLQDLGLRAQLESGDILMVRRFIPRGLFGTKIQLIEADRISNPNDELDTPTLSGGVKRDKNGRTLGYHVRDSHPGEFIGFGFDEWSWKEIPAVGAESGLWQAKLLYRRLRPGQTRGMPMLAPVVESLKQLDRYLEAELMATVLSSFFTVFVKTELGDGLAEVAGDETESPFDPNAQLRLGSGSVVELAPGEDIESANPNRPNQAFDGFVTAVLRQVGTALEIPFEVLVKHFQSSYSAARSALLEAWKFYHARRDWLSVSMCQPVYGAVMYEAVLRGMIEAPGFLDDPVLRQAWLGADWIGPAKGQIDPLKEIKAARERVSLGVSSIARETAEITGGDWEATHRQRVREHRMRQEAGLEGAVATSAEAPELPDPDDEDPDEADRREQERAA